MQRYELIRKMSPTAFKRLTGVKKSTFTAMSSIVRKAENNRLSRAGKPPHLGVEDRLLMALEYLREYRTYFHLGKSYGLSESACYRNCKWVEDILVKSKTFALPGKKVLLKNDEPWDVILVDATESPIERPKKKSKAQETSKKQKQPAKAFLLREKEETHIKNADRRG